MSRYDIIQAFVLGIGLPRYKTKTRSNSVNISPDYMRLYSYDTCIAQWIVLSDGTSRLIVNKAKYSNTTSHIQSLLWRILERNNYLRLVYIAERVPINTQELNKFI